MPGAQSGKDEEVGGTVPGDGVPDLDPGGDYRVNCCQTHLLITE